MNRGSNRGGKGIPVALLSVMVLGMMIAAVFSGSKKPLMPHRVENADLQDKIERYQKRLNLETMTPGITSNYFNTMEQDRGSILELLRDDGKQHTSTYTGYNRDSACTTLSGSPGGIPELLEKYCNQAKEDRQKEMRP